MSRRDEGRMGDAAPSTASHRSVWPLPSLPWRPQAGFGSAVKGRPGLAAARPLTISEGGKETEKMLARRTLALGGLALLASPRPAPAEPLPRVQVWRDPYCGCCGAWVEHMRAAGFPVEDNVVASVAAVRRMLGTPSDLLSCHAGLVGGFVLEGHVPALAVGRLLAERPAGVRGLAVPAMPIGSPGMEVPGEAPDTYEVIAFGDGAHRPFMVFRGGDPV